MIQLDNNFYKKFNKINKKTAETFKANKLTVTEAWIKRDYKIVKKTINLIVAPAGSGKTYLIFNHLIHKYNLKKTIYLCDTSNLKHAVIMDEEYKHLCKMFSRIDGNSFWDILNKSDGKVTVMTYAQFAILLKSDPYIYDNIECVLCDEIHNLIKYRNKFDNTDEQVYAVAINKLIEMKTYADIVCLTATPNVLRHTDMRKNHDFVEFNLTDNEIKFYKEGKREPFNQISNIVNNLKNYCDFENNKKVMIYTDKIKTVNKLVEMCEGLGLKAIGLWSMNNENHKMNDEQKEVRNSILENGTIPVNVDVLIINASYETGINIKNKNVECVIINSTDQDTLVQARNRIRCDIPLLLYKDNSVVDDTIIELNEKWLNKRLTKEEKEKICNELNLVNERGRGLKWTSIKKKLEENDYTIINKSTTVTDESGKREKQFYDVITK